MSEIRVTATKQGLPTRVIIPRAELRFGAQHIADQVLRQCRTVSNRSALAYRAHMESGGADPAQLTALGLPTVDEIAAQEHRDRRESETPVWRQQR